MKNLTEHERHLEKLKTALISTLEHCPNLMASIKGETEGMSKKELERFEELSYRLIDHLKFEVYGYGRQQLEKTKAIKEHFGLKDEEVDFIDEDSEGGITINGKWAGVEVLKLHEARQTARDVDGEDFFEDDTSLGWYTKCNDGEHAFRFL